MHLLYLKSYYHPEIAASSYLSNNLLEDLLKQKTNKVVLHVPSPSRGLSTEEIRKYKTKKIEEIYNGKLKVYRFAMFREGNNTFLRGVRYFLCHLIHFIKGVQEKNMDVLFLASTPPTQGAMGALVKKIKKIPMVYNLQDVFPDSLVATGLTHKGSLLWKIGRIIEDFTYRNADKIIVISEGFKKNIMDKGVPESKIEVIYNWVDENEVFPVEREHNLLFKRYNLDPKRFYVTYNGNVGHSQNMDLLLDIAIMFQDKPEIQFILMGEGAYKKQMEKRIVTEHISNVTLLPFQPYEEISHVFSMGDVGLVISKENVGQNSVPSKTWSIMSAARPVLASFDENSELHTIIEENNIGCFVKAGDKKALYDAIQYLYVNPDQREQFGQNGRNYILKN
ncbi:MAG: glycosyltransferase family 4 protein, partial [Cyclobacteriaceae bacterium]